MVFSSISFLYYFLPIVLVVYHLVPVRFKNTVLLVSSLLFYYLGETKYLFIIISSTTIDYILSLVIIKNRDNPWARRALITSIVVNLSILGGFKYIDFFIENINSLFSLAIPLVGVTLPLGISFFTFQTMSYTIDVYRGDAKVQGNPLAFATYTSLFPQLIAGPIVRYKTIANSLKDRVHGYEMFGKGVRRFIIGLAKKVLIANQLGEFVLVISKVGEHSVLSAWASAIAFSLQVYFDFSGYSDMAIGLGRMFGFEFLENFNYPYISKSITEFWRRWHISLGSWFRDYVYIPLGGNRVSSTKWFRNIIVVWFLTGFWHGASWNYIFWGLLFGGILFFEKYFFLDYLKRLPYLLRHLYVITVIVISFVIFKYEDVDVMIIQLKLLLGVGNVPVLNAEAIYQIKNYAMVFLLGVVASTPLFKQIESRLEGISETAPYWLIEAIVCAILMIVSTGYLVDSSFNPFLYYRF